MKPLIESVPNFSEGRRPEVIQALVATLRAIPEVRVLDVSSDPDHNRTVATLVGPPLAVQEAVFQAIRKAAELIDLDMHQGAHPRLGATDVAPFVPLAGVTLAECVALAHTLGERVGAELGIPVYFYAAAARRPERVALEDVRRGEYEQLKGEIGVNPARTPDCGPPVLGRAGATIIGARPFLVAFNAYLNSGELWPAQEIARAIRHSDGGFRYLKALGLLVAGQAQVSMNFTDFKRTPLPRVLETVRREAARYGLAVTRTELVGMLPESALIDTARWYLQLERLEPHHILEQRLAALDESAPWGFLDAVAADSPTPGSGSAAALVGALAAALTTLVARVTVNKRKYAAVAVSLAELILEAERLRASMTARIESDASAYQSVLEAQRLPRRSETDVMTRNTAVQNALQHAIEVPLATAYDALAALELALRVACQGNVHALADATAAGWMAMAAIQSALASVRINAAAITDLASQRTWLEECRTIDARAQSTLEQMQEAVEQRSAM